MLTFALLFDLTISAPKLRAARISPAPPNSTLIIHGPGWSPTALPIRTQGSITDISTAQTTQTQKTRSTLAQAAILLGYQQVADTSALVTSISTMAKAAYTAQFIPWFPQDLLTLDVPLTEPFDVYSSSPPTS